MQASTSQLFSFTAAGLTTAYALVAGGRPEKLGALLLLIAWFATPMLQTLSSWEEPQIGMFSVDLTTFGGLVLLGFFSHRLWCPCAAAFQLVAVSAYVPFWLWPHNFERSFYYVTFSIGYLLLGCLVGGCIVEAGPERRRTAAQRQLS